MRRERRDLGLGRDALNRGHRLLHRGLIRRGDQYRAVVLNSHDHSHLVVFAGTTGSGLFPPGNQLDRHAERLLRILLKLFWIDVDQIRLDADPLRQVDNRGHIGRLDPGE